MTISRLLVPKAIALYTEGKSTVEIARILNRDKNSVSQSLRAAGVEVAP